MFAENNNYEIMTPSGWKGFRGVSLIHNKDVFRVTLSNGSFVDATDGHYFFSDGAKIQLKNLSVGDCIDVVGGTTTVLSIEPQGQKSVYDIVEVDDANHQYIVNEQVVTKNCDEMSFIRPSIATEFWTSISPTLATGGKAMITSTPNLDDDQFAQIWQGANKRVDEYGNETEVGVNGFRPYLATWNQHPDRDEQWGKEEEGRVGTERFLREHSCQFISVEESLISSLTLANMKGMEPLRRTGQIRWYDDIKKDCAYVVGLDPSMGTGGDPAAIQVYSLPEFKQVAEWQHNKTDVRGQIRILYEILKDIHTELKSLGNKQPEIYWSVENNTLGEAHLIVIDEMGEDLFPGEFLSEPRKAGSTRAYRKGFTTTHGSKSVACMKMKSWIETEKMTPMSKNLIRELKTFIAKGKSYAAKQGEHDDLVTASLLCVRMVQVISQYDEKYEEILGASLDDESYELDPMPVVF